LGELLLQGRRCDRSGPRWCAFLEFHQANPWVYDQMLAAARALMHRGFRQYGSHTIMHALRYQRDLETGGDDVEIAGGDTLHVKLNNNHAAYYARLIIENHPQEFAMFFELRAAEGDPEDEEAEEPEPEPPRTWDGAQGALW
jgi:hypothetical protein